jgi:hypothetical protein
LVLNYNSITNDQNNSKSVSIEDLSVRFDNLDHIQHIITNNYVHFNHKTNVKQAIGKWAVDFNVLQNAVNALLDVLKNKAGLDFLPKDCRT